MLSFFGIFDRFLYQGYRAFLPYRLCLKSLFIWSNETINIWTHLLGKSTTCKSTTCSLYVLAKHVYFCFFLFLFSYMADRCGGASRGHSVVVFRRLWPVIMLYLGWMFFFGLQLYDNLVVFPEYRKRVTKMELIIGNVSLLCFQICMAMSVCFHVFGCHSEKVCQVRCMT